MEFLLIYLYTVLEKFSVLAGVTIFALLAGILITAIVTEYGEEADKIKELFFRRWVFYTLAVCLALLVLTPSKKDVAWIIGGGVAYNVATTDEAKKLPDNVLGALNRFIESAEEHEADEDSP